MDTDRQFIAQEATKLAAHLPLETMEIVARSIADGADNLAEVKARLSQDLPHPHYRSLATDFVEEWKESAGQVTAHEVSMAVLAATHSEKKHRERQSVELVWTGPEADEIPFRRTKQAILQVLDSAQKKITLVSYAVYRIPGIQAALVEAARRGVRITVIVETPDKLEGTNEYSTLQALGDEVASCSSVYYWPKEKRETGEGGRLGILHVKCAVADGHWLFLSSANLTKYAFTLNMELGVLVTGGPMPQQVEQRFEKLIARGTLSRL